MNSTYKYHGYLKSLQGPPDPQALAGLEQIRFDADDLKQWKINDDPAEKEWCGVQAHVKRTDEGVLLLGHFENIRRIDNLDRNELRYWAPLSLSPEDDPRFPADCLRYPMVEIVYRCKTSRAYPACQWNYPGGAHLVFLDASSDWQTAALLMSHREFPEQLWRFAIRLYTSWRSTESIEVAELRFRGLVPDEAAALERVEAEIAATAPSRHFPVLDEFLPFGVHMNVSTAERLAELLDISTFDYWRLAFEDIARHHHNCVVLEGTQRLSRDACGVVFELAENFGLRLIPTLDWPMERYEEEGAALVDTHIRPYADSGALLAWNIVDAPSENCFQALLKAREDIAAVDPNHPVTIHTRQADTFPLFAPFFAASGFSYFKSGDPWGLGETIRTHLNMVGGQQFWITAPAFVYASNAPDWNTSPQMRLMLNLAMANGARGWFSHTYHNVPVWVDGHYQRSLTGPFLTFSDLWAELGNRIERISVLAPLLLSARPIPPPEHIHLNVFARKHVKSMLGEAAETTSMFWLEGPDYYLVYIVNNDTDQVTAMNLDIAATLPGALDIYDTTALVRTRAWLPSEHKRHIEMFPGQGQLFLVAEPPVCAHWRDVIARRILMADQRQTRVDLELARQYRLDVEEISAVIHDVQPEATLEDLRRVHVAREKLFNLIYATPEIYEPRQILIKTSSIICGCDEALGQYHGKGHVDMARELGVRVIPLARALTALRVKLRRGHGGEIGGEAATLARQSDDLLREIWNSGVE